MNLLTLLVAVLPGAQAAPTIPEAVQVAAFRAEVTSDKFVYCLETAGADSSPAVISALAADRATVVARSECDPVINVSTGSVHRATGRKAMLVSVSDYRRIDQTHIEIRLHWYHHGRWGGVDLLTLTCKDGVWAVSQRQHEWVS